MLVLGAFRQFNPKQPYDMKFNSRIPYQALRTRLTTVDTPSHSE
jgi:hypothetical protein